MPTVCVTAPGQVLDLCDGMALIRGDGRPLRASVVLVPEVVVGDWVIVAAGMILEVVQPEAHQIRALINGSPRQEEAAK